MGERANMKVRVRDFQSIKEAEIEVGGISVIVGPSDIGKSAFIRAVNFALSNKLGNWYVNHDASMCSVEFEEDGEVLVKWEKGKKVNRYTVSSEPEPFNKVGRGVVPQQVFDALGIHEIDTGKLTLLPQVQSQHAYAFILDMTEGEISASLSSLTDAALSLEAARLCASDLRENASLLKLRRSDLEEAEERLVKFEGVDEVAISSQALEELLKELHALGDLLGRAEEFGALESFLNSIDISSVEVTEPEIPVRRFKVIRGLGEYGALAELPEIPDDLVPQIGIGESQVQALVQATEYVELESLPSIEEVKVPSEVDTEKLADVLRDAEEICTLMELPNMSEVSLPSTQPGLTSAIETLARYQEVVADIGEVQVAIDEAESGKKQAELEHHELLADYEECPLCGEVAHG